MLGFAAMSAVSEAPAAYRAAATDPGAFALVAQAVRDVLSRRRLVTYLVQAEVKKRGINTVLGNLWWVLDPLLLMGVYVVLVTVLARGQTIPDYPLFIFAAVLPWKWFTTSVQDATGSVVNQHRLVKQIAFPKIVLPVAATTAGIVGFGFGLIALAMMMVFYLDRLSIFLVLIPLIAVVQYVFTMAVAVLVAAGNVFFRDLGNVMRHLLRLWFYLSPGLYSLSLLDSIDLVQRYPVIKTLAAMNPFAVLFEAYRGVIYGTPETRPAPPDWLSLGILLLASLLFLAVSSIVFKRLERNFAKVL